MPKSSRARSYLREGAMQIGSTSRWDDNLDSITARNAQQAPLLRLPAELRNRIYDLLFERRTIHIDVRGRPCRLKSANNGPRTRQHNFGLIFSHVVCLTETSDAEAYTLSKDPDLEPHRVRDPYCIRHKECEAMLSVINVKRMYSGGGALWANRLPPVESVRISLAILQVCRQINDEAALIPFATNTFAFADPEILELFVDVLTPRSREAIASLQAYNWTRLPKKRTVGTLKGLRKVQCFLNDRNNLGEWMGVPEMDVFSTLRAENVTAMIETETESCFDGPRREERVMRRKCAAEVEEMMRKR